MDVTYYPGCSLESSAKDYSESIRAVCNVLDIRLNEPEDWTCCGATSAHSINDDLSVLLAGRNLVAAQQMKHQMLVPCPLCFNRLVRAQKNLASDVDIFDLARFMSRPQWLDRIKARMVSSLAGIKAVCYYGCMANRPPELTGSQNYENPCDMDDIVRTLGVETIDWSYKTDCCGASFSISKSDIVHALVQKLYDRALAAGAECIVVSCQMCQANLDLYQDDISAISGNNYRIPIFYFTELMGLAFGLDQSRQWLSRHMVDPVPYLNEKDIRLT